MKIVILHECFLNQEHIDWLKKCGEVIIYKDTDTEQKAIKRLQDADIAIVDQFIIKFNQNILQNAKNLKLLVLNSISFSHIDLETASKQKIKVVNLPGFSKQTVAEFAVGLMFDLSRKISLGDRLMRKNLFELDPGNKEHQQFVGFELKGKTLGIIGLGNIGTSVAQIGKALGMQILAFNRSKKNVKNVPMCSLQELLKQSDIITIHLPFNPQTKNLISKKELNIMKKNAVIINTCQPEIINTNALYHALKDKKIYGAALDCGTMIPKNSPLLQLENVIVTPHLGSFTTEAFFINMPNMIVETVELFIKGKHINQVN